MVVCGYPLVNKPGDAPVFVNAKASRKQAFARPPGYTTNHGFPVFSWGCATYQATTGKTLIVSCFKRHTTPLCIRSLVLATAQVKMFPKWCSVVDGDFLTISASQTRKSGLIVSENPRKGYISLPLEIRYFYVFLLSRLLIFHHLPSQGDIKNPTMVVWVP